jgi:UDP-glucose 4-epimerase
MGTDLVTGGAGFIGRRLVAELKRRGRSVRVFDRALGQDIRDADAMKAALAGVDRVFHLAAVVSIPESTEDPVTCHDVNVSATKTLVDLCGDRPMLFVSSASIYGSQPVPHTETSPPAPASEYARSKLAAEPWCSGKVVVRLFNAYGPGQDKLDSYGIVIRKFFRWALRNEPLQIYGDGHATRDFIYVDDVAEGFAAALDCGKPGIYNIGTGVETSVLELAAKVRGITGRYVPVQHLPARPGDALRSKAETSKARETFDFSAKVDLDRGLSKWVIEGGLT